MPCRGFRLDDFTSSLFINIPRPFPSTIRARSFVDHRPCSAPGIDFPDNVAARDQGGITLSLDSHLIQTLGFDHVKGRQRKRKRNRKRTMQYKQCDILSNAKERG